ncbi:hypothetical protein BDB01DRAFT_906331 [Pilobolus umbonatus]|nr:hypothetical protein BDB01DRAFT_906331 [Pilobolus umbonatus]
MSNMVNKLSTHLTIPTADMNGFNSDRRLSTDSLAVSSKRKHYDKSSDSNIRNISSEYQGIQIRTLTKWINVQLSDTGDSIKSIEKDLKDGKILLKLLSVVANNNSLRPERGNMRIHQLSNVAHVLEYLKEQWGEDTLAAIGNEAIVNGDVKNTLALVFFIMLKYQIQPILHEKSISSSLTIPPPIPVPSLSGSKSSGNQLSDAKNALLRWVRFQLEDYINHQIISNIQDFSRSWRSGLPFCLLIHRYDPYLLPTLFTEYIGLEVQKEHADILLKLAFDTAEEHMKIPQYLECTDFIGVEFPHEPSVMMYISEMYKVISASQKKIPEEEVKQQEMKRLEDILVVSKVHDITPTAGITPPYSTVDEEIDIHMEDDSPGTPKPEKIVDKDSYLIQKLDTITSLLNTNEIESIEQLVDNKEKSQSLLEETTQLMAESNLSPQEKEVVMTRYNQLKDQWELISAKLEEQYHPSFYTNTGKDTDELDTIMLELEQIRPKIRDEEGRLVLLHPLDGTPEIAHEFERSLIYVSKLINAYQQKNNDRLSPKFTKLVSEFNLTEKADSTFGRGVTFAQITAAINDELDVIQQLMMNSESQSVTEDMVNSLKEKIGMVGTLLQGVRDEYREDLLSSDVDHFFDRFITRIDLIEDRYETVRQWVDKVCVCFEDAQRIRRWIDEHIQTVNSRNQSDRFDPLSPDVNIDDRTAIYIHEEQEKLNNEIDSFCADDMSKLKAHAKLLSKVTAVDGDSVELSPADTATIEITLTTLNMLNYLTRIMSERTEHIQLLLLRLKWEDQFGNAVQWIATTDGELDNFLREKARWTEKECDVEVKINKNLHDTDHSNDSNGIELIIKTLVSLERRISDFDQGIYADILDSYQAMQDLKSETLPEHLEARQSGFETAFEDLMKRSSFSRKVVEQFLSMISVVEKFKELRDRGEKLRQSMLRRSSGFKEKRLQSAHDTQSDSDEDESEDYDETVRLFKEDSARLITNISTCIPYPGAPEMATAIGANDAHDNEVTREAIRVTIGTYTTSLALLADALDQLLMSRYQITSLQQRATDAFDSLVRVQVWMKDKIKLLKKTRLDVMLYSPMATSSSSDTVKSSERDYHSFADEETVLRLEKERDNVASRLNQMEQEDLSKLFETVRILEYDVDASSAVSIDRNALVNGVESLELAQQELNSLLVRRAVELDGLKKRLEWESQWSKANSFLQTIARKLCDFSVKKARYDPSKENTDRPSYDNDSETMQSFQYIQSRFAEFGDRQLVHVLDTYQEMFDCYAAILDLDDKASQPNPILVSEDSIIPDFIAAKQTDLSTKHEDLKTLLSYTSDLISQRSCIIEFLMRVHDVHHEGEKIKDYISKKLRRIMNKDEDEEVALDNRITQFKTEINNIWNECGKDMQYPVYNGSWLRVLHNSSAESGAAYRAQVRAQIKSLLDKKMDDLRTFEKSIDQSIESYRAAENIRSLVMQYENEAMSLRQWIDENLERLRNQHVDVSAENLSAMLYDGNVSDLQKSRQKLIARVEEFENTKVRNLHDQVGQLIESIQKKKMQSVNISQAARNLGEVMERLSQLKCSLTDHATSLEAANKREEWENNLAKGIEILEQMNEQLHQFNVEKNEYASGDLTSNQVKKLEENLDYLNQQKNRFEDHILPNIQMSYDAFIEYFPQLPRPMATPDHLESRMESLGRICARFQESMAVKSRELDLLKKRISWENTVREALEYLSRQEITIDEFIENKARWKANDDISNDNDEEQLRTEWYSLYDNFEHYRQDVIQPLQTDFEKLINEADANVFNNTGSFLPNAFMNKMKSIENAKDRVSYYLSFSNDVVSQRCLVSAFILRTAQLEQSAELIREEFISSKALGHIEDHVDRLEKFKSGIEDVKVNLAATIPYPIRDEDDATNQSRIHDETTNTLIIETVRTRNNQLDEIYQGLQALLDSKERISRRRLSFHYFKKQADVTESWISSRIELLEKSDVSMAELTSLTEMDKINKLKEAVGQADVVERSMKGNDTVFNSLVNTYDKVVHAFSDKSLDEYENHDDEHQQLVEEVSSTVGSTHKRISQLWETLQVTAKQALKDRTAYLIETKIQEWLDELNALLDVITQSEKSEHVLGEFTAYDEQISNWQMDICNLEMNGHHNLVADLEGKRKLLDENQINQFTSKLESGKEIIQQVKDQLVIVQEKHNLCRLVNLYTDNIQKLQKQIEDELLKIQQIHEQYAVVYTDSANHRNSHLQSLILQSKQLTTMIVEIKDHFDEASEQFQVIQKKSPGSQVELDRITHDAFNKIIAGESNISKLMYRNSKWNKCYELLTETEQNYLKIEDTMHKNEDVNQVETQLNSVQLALKSQMKLDDELVKDNINFEPFVNKAQELFTVITSSMATVSGLIKEKEKESLLSYIEKSITGWCNECSSQLGLIHLSLKEDVFNPNESEIKEWDNTQIENHVQSLMAVSRNIVKDTRDKTSNITSELDHLRATRIEEAYVKYGGLEGVIKDMLVPLYTQLDEMESLMQVEDIYITVLSKLLDYHQLSQPIIQSVNDTRYKLKQIIESMEDFNELECQIEGLNDNIKEFNASSDTIIQESTLHNISKERQSLVQTCAREIHKHVLSLWDVVQSEFTTVKVDFEMSIKYQKIVSKLKDTIQYVDALVERVNGFNLTKGVISEEKEFEELCKEKEASLEKKSEEIGSHIDPTVKDDVYIIELQLQLSHKINELERLLLSKRKEAGDEDCLAPFFHLMDQFEEQINLLSSAIDNASPHHSRMVNNKFVKTDLQSLLKSLIAVYKKHHGEINQILKKAQQESSEKFSDSNARVNELLQKAQKKWVQIQASASGRERELQTCVNQLDHEFFTKLAMAKSSPKTRRPPPTPHTKRVLSSSRLLPAVKMSENGHDGHHRHLSNTPSTTLSATKTLKASYVPDPKNALDIELGNIVNASPYRVTVKMIPGQVGKYWFGDENPRLVYCRILSSQLVMVRVGGGWVELSKFLRDHRLTEGPQSRSDSNIGCYTPETSPFQETYLQTVRAVSPSGRVTLRGGGGTAAGISGSIASTRSSSKSSSRSKSPLPGFVDGDKYVSLDESGNHIYVKMKKAEYDAKTPIVKKKSQSN